MSPIRMLMFDNEFPPLGGGTGVVNLHLFREWSRHADVWVDLVTSSRSRNQHEEEAFSERIRIFKVPVHNRNLHHARNIELIRYYFRGLARARKLLDQQAYDICFSFSTVPAGAIGCELSRTHAIPHLVSLQGPDIPGFEARYNYLYPFLTPFLRKIWRQAALVTAISAQHYDLALACEPQIEIEIIPNAVDAERFAPAAATSPVPWVRAVCVGRLIERKGQHHLLRALAQARGEGIPEIRLNLVGTGDAEASLKALARDLGIADRVTFSGVVQEADMPAVYHNADLFILPSQNEGMSVALLEAMASGLPVIVTQTGGTQELVDSNGQVVRWDDVQGLSGALVRLAADPEARARMGRRSRTIALQYNWTAFADAYLHACRRVVARARRE